MPGHRVRANQNVIVNSIPPRKFLRYNPVHNKPFENKKELLYTARDKAKGNPFSYDIPSWARIKFVLKPNESMQLIS